MEKSIESLLEERFGKVKIAEMRAAFPGRKLNVIVVEDKLCVLRPLTAKDLSSYSMLVMKGDEGLEQGARYLLDALWLGGDEEIRNDEDYFMAAMLQIQNSVELKKSDFYRF